MHTQNLLRHKRTNFQSIFIVFVTGRKCVGGSNWGHGQKNPQMQEREAELKGRSRQEGEGQNNYKGENVDK